MLGLGKDERLTSVQRIEKKINFNYLDRLIAGEEAELTDSLRYWRTRFMLIPSDKPPNPMSDPSGQPYKVQDILINGAAKLLEMMGRNQWHRGDSQVRSHPPRLLPTTFDPSACVLDEGLMAELERITSGKDDRPVATNGKKLAGMSLSAVASAMAEPDNGLSIRDRWWQRAFFIRLSHFADNLSDNSRGFLHRRRFLHVANIDILGRPNSGESCGVGNRFPGEGTDRCASCFNRQLTFRAFQSDIHFHRRPLFLSAEG